MATIINNPGNGEESTSGIVSLIIGVILLVMIGVLFFMYVLPTIRNASENTEAEKTNTIDVNFGLQDTGGESETQTQTQ